MRKENILWDRVAKSFHEVSSRSKAHKDKYQQVANIALKLQPKNILDLGCGSGILEKELLERGFKGNIVAVDASQSMLEIGREIAVSEKVKFIKADLDKDFLIEEKFDVVVSINLLFFLEDKIGFLNRVKKCLKEKNSTFVLITPKPYYEASTLEFIKAHFENTNTKEKFFIAVNELSNLPRYIKMALNQNKLNDLEKNGVIKCDSLNEIKALIADAKLTIVDSKEIHAKQNWLFVLKKV